jgi:capsular polysaccharide biosynthesis protein/Mrp family chromosome partitioning ATPase
MTELISLWAAVTRRWFGVCLLTLGGALSAAGLNLAIPVTYTATAQLFLATPIWNDSTAISDAAAVPLLTSYGDQFTQQRMASYQRLALTPVVTGPVADSTGLTAEQLSQRIVTRPVPDTVILEIAVQDGSAETAATLADAVANQLTEVIRQVEKPSYNRESPVQPVLIRPAGPPSSPTSPRVLLNITAGVGIGLLLGVTHAMVRESQPRRRRTGAADAAVPLGVLRAADLDTDGGAPVVMSEDVRFLRVQLVNATKENETNTILLAAPHASEYAWEVGVQLANALSEKGFRTVLVLADFGMQITGRFGPGLGDILLGSADLAGVLAGSRSGPAVVLAGMAPRNRTAALTGNRMDKVLSVLSHAYDYTLVVAPAILESSDAADLADRMSGTVLVVPPGQADPLTLEESRRLLRGAGSTYLGAIVVNDSEARLVAR